MAALTEFYISTMWAYHPPAVERMINELSEQSFDNVEYTLDAEYQWFKVVCQKADEAAIRDVFKEVARNIEEEAFSEDSTKILNADETLKDSIENALIGHLRPSAAVSGQAVEALQEFAFPKHFLENYAHHATWRKLENSAAGLTFTQLITPDNLDQMQKDTEVDISHDLAEKLVYIGGNDSDSVRKAQEKLDVLLEIRSLRFPQTEHLLYVEDYVDDQLAEPTADVRYMIELDGGRLVTSTLLDPVQVKNLEIAYRRLRDEGATIRLCPYDSDKGFHVSLSGPKVVQKPGRKTLLGNRPSISSPDPEKPAEQDANPKITDQQSRTLSIRIKEVDESTELDKNNEVATWMKNIPDNTKLVADPSDDRGTVLQESATCDKSILDSKDLNAVKGFPALADTLISESISSEAYYGPLAMLSAPPESNGDETCAEMRASTSHNTRSAADGEELDSFLGSRKSFKSATANTLPPGLRPPHGFMPMSPCGPNNPPLFESCNAVELARATARPASVTSWEFYNAVQTASRPAPITWDMPSLVPENVRPVNALASTSVASNLQTKRPHDRETTEQFKHFLNPKAATFKTMNQRARSRRKQGSRSYQIERNNNDLKAQASRKSAFSDEIDAAIDRLLATSPYRRGKVALRLDFGRIILGGVAPSGLAVNEVNTRSNGWQKKMLMKLLNQDLKDQGVLFSKILTTNGSEVEHMIKTKDDETSACLWNTLPNTASVTYSFHCALSHVGGQSEFIVDITGSTADSFAYSIRACTSRWKADGLTPLLIHGLLRNWDLRVMLSHSDTKVLEKLEPLAEDIYRDFQLLNAADAEGSRLTFSIPDGKGLAVKAVRVLTKWRHHSSDNKSALDITEVEQLKLMDWQAEDSPTDSKTRFDAHSWSQADARHRKKQGEFPRWYEVSIVSTELEEAFKENESLRVGEKATRWTVDDLRERGVFQKLYGPALKMLTKMDDVGGNENNHIQRPTESGSRRQDGFSFW